MVSALKTELLRAMTLVDLSSLSAYKEKEYVRPVTAFRNFVSVALWLVFTFVRLSCQSLTYALCLEKLSLHPCALLLTVLPYPVPLTLRLLLLLFLLFPRLQMPNLCYLMTWQVNIRKLLMSIIPLILLMPFTILC